MVISNNNDNTNKPLMSLNLKTSASNRISLATEEPLETTYLFQCISVVIQWANVVSFMSTTTTPWAIKNVPLYLGSQIPCFVVDFYPRDAMLARVIEIATCLSVRLSVRLSRAGIVSKRRKLSA